MVAGPSYLKPQKRVLITNAQLNKLGGVANYYSVLRPYLDGNISYFTVGKRLNENSLQVLWRMPSDFIRFKREVSKYDIIHVNPSLLSKSLIRDGFLIRLAKKKKKKVVVFFRGWNKDVEKQIKKRWLQLFRKYYFTADCIIVLSDEIRQSLIEMGYNGPIYIETTVVDDSIFKNFNNAKSDRNTVNILFLTRIEKYKGIFEAIRTFELLQKNGSNINMNIAGIGDELEPAKKYVSGKGITGINFMGYLTGKDKADIFKSSDIYFLPSYGEGMPNSLLEAMAYGLPVITRPVGGLKDFFIDKKMGFLTASKEPEAFAKLIELLIYSPDLRQKMGEFNSKYAERFKASLVAMRLQDIYETISVCE
jgi:glycosyltransferase involved in cell wall biosynthesis